MRVLFVQKSKPLIFGCHAHTHPCYEIVITTKGQSCTHLENSAFEVQKGSLVFLPPNTLHWHTSQEGFADICLHTDQNPFGQTAPFSCLDTSNSLVQLAEMANVNYLQKDNHYEAINIKLLEAVCEYVVRLQGQQHKWDFVWKFKELLTQNLSNVHFDIAAASCQMGVSFDYMRHKFKDELGQTPLEYLTYIRIRQAKRLLEHNPLYRVAEIAEMCGYSDPFYFSKTFKTLVGVSPREFRQSKTNK